VFISVTMVQVYCFALLKPIKCSYCTDFITFCYTNICGSECYSTKPWTLKWSKQIYTCNPVLVVNQVQCLCWPQQELLGSHKFAWQHWSLQSPKHASHQNLLTQQYKYCYLQSLLCQQGLVGLRRAGWICSSVQHVKWAVNTKIGGWFK
jgi:hypothetical protein